MKRLGHLVSTDRFSWIHVPKTGGTWLHRVLTSHAPKSWRLSSGPPAHVSLHDVPDSLSFVHGLPDRVGLPIVATVRNPWDWYVSLYFWLEQHRVNRTGGFALPPNRRSEGLRVWEQRFAKGNTVEAFRSVVAEIAEAVHLGEMGVRPQRAFLRDGHGRLGVDRVLRFESLRSDTVEALEELGAEVTPKLRSAIGHSPRENTSGHCHYSLCYDEKSRAAVARYDEWLIDQFEYRFEGAS